MINGAVLNFHGEGTERNTELLGRRGFLMQRLVGVPILPQPIELLVDDVPAAVSFAPSVDGGVWTIWPALLVSPGERLILRFAADVHGHVAALGVAEDA